MYYSVNRNVHKEMVGRIQPGAIRFGVVVHFKKSPIFDVALYCCENLPSPFISINNQISEIPHASVFINFFID